MKKKLFLPIALVLLLVLAACGGDPAEIVSEAATRGGDVAATAGAVATDVADGPDSEEEADVVEPTEVPTEEPTEEPTPEPTDEPTATPEPTEVPVSGVTGQVVDSDSSEPLVGGRVCVQGTEQCASVDESGMYSLAELDPAEYVFEVTATNYVTATQTISLAAGETLTQDFALTAELPILAVLPTDVVLRGGLYCIGGAPCSTGQNEATISIGNSFQFLEAPINTDVPAYNLSFGDVILAVVLNGTVDVLVPNRSETELGKATNDLLEGTTLYVKTAGEGNQSIQLDDLMEVVLTDPSSSNPPYTVNFYRGEGEARELVATFTINNQ